MTKLEEEIQEILEKNYDNPIGGDKTTHWYVNDVAREALAELFRRRIDDNLLGSIVEVEGIEGKFKVIAIHKKIAKELKGE